MTEATFQVAVGPKDARAFAELSGDWNPLHTDAVYAMETPYGRPILHGAFSAGLVSRMAGLHIPGSACLLGGMQLRFLHPVVPPVRLVVHGKLVAQHGDTGRVSVTVSDADSGRRYVQASYEFARHSREQRIVTPATVPAAVAAGEPRVLVTGASGGIGQAMLKRLGPAALGVSRRPAEGLVEVADLECIAEVLGDIPLAAVIHCAWPAPDSTRLTALARPGSAVEHHVAQPLRQMIRLAQLLLQRGTPDALLVLVGSTWAEPGRHNYRVPLYALGKGLVPSLCRILAVELGAAGRRCVAVVFDVVDAGMNKAMSTLTRLAHQDRVPSGRLPSADEVADQVAWVIENRSALLSGATLTLSGGALP